LIDTLHGEIGGLFPGFGINGKKNDHQFHLFYQLLDVLSTLNPPHFVEIYIPLSSMNTIFGGETPLIRESPNPA
jgi:hypothetical protein